MQDKVKAQLAAALVATLGLTVPASAQAAPHQGSSMRVEQSSGFSTSSEDLSDKKKKDKADMKKGSEGSCKGKEGSCKGKEGSCKAKDEAKGKEGSCKGKEGSCKAH